MQIGYKIKCNKPDGCDTLIPVGPSEVVRFPSSLIVDKIGHDSFSLAVCPSCDTLNMQPLDSGRGGSEGFSDAFVAQFRLARTPNEDLYRMIVDQEIS